jgi:methyl-accepting chemotaxis protein
MDDSRKQASMTAKAVSEQANGVKQLAQATRDCARLASHVTKAIGEQTGALASLARDGDQVRRLAKQAQRTIEEQTETAAAITSVAARTQTNAAALAKVMSEQATLIEQLGTTHGPLRAKTREATSTAVQQDRRSSTLASEAGDLSAKLEQMGRVQTDQMSALTALRGSPPSVRENGDAGRA